MEKNNKQNKPPEQSKKIKDLSSETVSEQNELLTYISSFKFKNTTIFINFALYSSYAIRIIKVR